MTFWDGTRWVDERAAPPPKPTPRRRSRDWIATGIMALGLVGLMVPVVSTSASTPSARSLLHEWSEAGTIRRFNEVNTRIAYTGTWTLAGHRGYIGGHVKFADAAGAKASLSFKGSAVTWIGPVGPTRGKARVWIDGKYVTTVDTHAKTFRATKVLFKTSWPKVGE